MLSSQFFKILADTKGLIAYEEKETVKKEKVDRVVAFYKKILTVIFRLKQKFIKKKFNPDSLSTHLPDIHWHIWIVHDNQTISSIPNCMLLSMN